MSGEVLKLFETIVELISMKLRLLTLFSVVVALAIKTYSINAQDGVIDDAEVEVLANWQLINKKDTLHHQKHVNKIVTELAESPYVAEKKEVPAQLPTDSYKQYSRLKRAAHEHELNQLLTHESPVVRIYAHRALVENAMQADAHCLEAMSMDSTCVTWLDGDLLIETTVMDMVSSNLFPTPIYDESEFENDDLASDSTMLEVDSNFVSIIQE